MKVANVAIVHSQALTVATSISSVRAVRLVCALRGDSRGVVFCAVSNSVCRINIRPLASRHQRPSSPRERADGHSFAGSVFAGMAMAGNAEKAQGRDSAEKTAFGAASNFQ